MKYILSEKKNTLDKIRNTLGTAEENSEFEERNKSTLISTKNIVGARGRQRLSYLWDSVKLCNM